MDSISRIYLLLHVGVRMVTSTQIVLRTYAWFASFVGGQADPDPPVREQVEMV